PSGRVQDLLQALVDHVTVALKGEHGLVGLHALDAGRDRGSPAVQGLHEVDVERARERRIAPDADDADRRGGEPQVGEGLEEDPQGDRLPAARAQVVLTGLQQRRRLVAHLVEDGLVDGHASTPSSASAASMRPAMTSTSRRGPTPKPEWSVEMPPIDRTGARPSTANRTSSTICPAFSSNTRTLRMPTPASATASVGNGHRVMGRTYPTRRPWPRRRRTA